MATNWWEIGKPVQDFEPVAQEKKEQNWWEIGQPVEEPPKVKAAPDQPDLTQQGTRTLPSVGLGPFALLRESLKPITGSDPIAMALAGGARLTGSAIETAGRAGEAIGDVIAQAAPVLDTRLMIDRQGVRLERPTPEQISSQNQLQYMQDWADSFKNWGREINQEPGTKLSDLADNPLRVVPFVIERVIASSPDMVAAAVALPAYIPTRANEILNQRLKNDDRSLNEATIGDVAAATSAAFVEGTLEKFATGRLGAIGGTGVTRVGKEAALQAGTEAIEEVGALAGETAGTERGFKPEEAGAVALEAAIVGGGLGGAIGAAAQVEENAIRRDIESRIRDIEGIGSVEERRRIQELRDKALNSATAIAPPEPAQVNVEEGQTEPTPLQFGEAYANRIFDSVGQYIPSNVEFKVEEKTIDGTPQYVVTDQENRQYGQAIQNKDQADSLALSLNNTGKARAEVLQQLQPLSESLTSILKGYGLNDIGLTLNNRIFTRRGEALTSEGLFDPVVRRVFLAVDAVDPQGNLDSDQRRTALRGVLRHEVVHALRYLDLWKKSEWKNLEKTVSSLKKPGTDKTYLDIAKEGYGDQTPIIQVEEAVAELIRDVAVKQSNVAGKPRSLSERAVQFFDRAKNALTGSGFQTYEDIVNRFERGEVGARERGRIRTFRASEEQAAEKGFVPERLQRILKTPDGRNQFRADTIQNLIGSLPQQLFAAPAMNSLGNTGIRESRSTIEQIPTKITVDDQDVPTRDSEGRVIYSGYEGPEMFGMQTRPTQEGLQNFWRWFGKSKAVDSNKRPLVFYHGTAADISAFRPKQAGSVFVTRSPQFAEEFGFLSDNYMVSNFPDFMSDPQVLEVLDETLANPASFSPKLYDQVTAAREQAVSDVRQNKAIRPAALKVIKDIAAQGRSSRYLNAIQKRLPSSANMMPVYVKADNPFDYDNKEHISRVLKKVKEISPIDLDSGQIEQFKKGDWKTIEGEDGNSPILDAIRELGYDSMYVEEQGEKNLAVFDPGQIKSAVGNNGDFSPLTPSIRESRKQPVYNIVNSRTGEVVGEANTISGARRAVDRRDNQYGANVHTIQVVDAEGDREQRAKSRERLGLPVLRESRRSGSEAFENKLIEDMRVPDFKSKEKLIEMNIDDFLNLAKQGYMPSKAKDISDLSKEGKKFTSLPFLQVSLNNEGVLKVVGHEGRHRARFLRDTGYQSIPVILKTLDPNSIRWSEQDNPRSFDYVDNWPTRIEAQEGSFSIPMPVSREQSMVPYGAKGVRESRKPIQVRMPRIPGVMEDAPILPIGDVEQSLIDLFKQTNSPTSEQLAQIPGAPTKRAIKDKDGKVIDDPRDTEVRPISMDELREMARSGLRNSEDVLWYMQFGTGLSDIVGPANLGEAAVIFGITSQQNSAEQNVADTLHIMRLAREIDPVANPKKFENAVRNKPRPDGQRLKITGDQINRIIRLYKEGFAEAGLKTSTYMQLIQDRAANRFNPFSVQDVHMARVYGFRRKERDPKSGNLVDGAKIPGDLQYRYSQFLTSKLAEEFGVSPDRMQAALWFYAKTKLSPKEKGGKPGTWKSASSYSQPEIDYINGMAEREEFDKNQALTPALREGVRPQNAIKTVIAPYSNTAQAEQLLELARQRAPTALVSATPGNARGYGFPDGTPMELITQFNRDAIGAITDQDGQIPFLRELGIPHEVRLGYGTYGVLEPNIQIKLLGGTPQQAKIVANILGDALLQDAAIFGQPTQKADRVNNFGVAVTKADRSEFTPDELTKIADAVNPTKATDDGINFTLIQPNVLSFLDSRSFGDGYEVDNMLPEFHGNITSLLPPDMNFEAVVYTQEGDYFGHQDYKSRIEEAWNSGSLGGSPDIFQRINDSLYQPFWNEYTRFRETNNLGPSRNPRPESFFPTTPVVPKAREARRRGQVPLGPEQPGPDTNTDNTGAAEALNIGEPTDTLGIPTGPQLTDTMPDGTVDISRARLEPRMQRLIRGVEFIQSAPDKLRGGVGLGDIASRIEGYFDTYRSRLGQVNDIIRDAYKNIGLRNRTSALETFERYIRARENGRIDDAEQIRAEASDTDVQLINAWEEIARLTGQINLNVTTPEGKPMRVYDAKVGGWRPIRAVQEFFPRTLRKEVMEVMKNPDIDPALYEELLDALIASGRVSTRNEAEDYLVREWFSDEIKSDYFAGVEKARTEPLPEIFYDYSWDAATRYLRKWARRTSQIEYFGQALGNLTKDWFDTNIPKVRDEETQQYLNEIKDRIYEVEPFDMFTNMASWMNSLATATQLGNPASASVNLLGGTISNVQEFGIKEIAKSYLDLVREWKNVQKEGTRLGILNNDVMNILTDHVEQDAQKYFSTEQKVSAALAKFANVMLTVGGFNGAENIVRASALIAARGRLNKFLNDVNEGRNNQSVQDFYTWLAKENLNADELILENGAGKATERYLRRAVNVPQGSYSIDMTPVFVDQPIGRFLFKYQKFGTQINRFFYRHFLKKFMDDPTPRNFFRTATFVGSAIIGGGAILAVREALGYGDPGPDDEELKKALENKDISRAWGLIFSRAWQNIMAAGSLGFYGNYIQFGLDWQDQQRIKNPLSPPGLASIDAVVDIFNRLRDQKAFTARDADEIAETSLSAYRAYKRIALAGMAAIGADAREVRRFVAQRDLREVREYTRRYSEEMEIEFKRRTAPGAPIRTPMTPTNKAIADALHQGDSARARLLMNEALKGQPPKERERMKQSIRASIRNRQPIQIGDSSPSSKEKQEFLRWARKNLPASAYQKIITADRRYRRAAARMGMSIGD